MSGHREAVRVLCADDQHRVLLIHWRDPIDGTCVWEPPGGGVEPGEGLLEAARRELREETGLPGDAIENPYVNVWRDLWWNGKHYEGEGEFFFYAPFNAPSAIVQSGLTEYETEWFHSYQWVPWQEVPLLSDPVEPPQILEILCRLAPEGPWAGQADGKGRP